MQISIALTLPRPTSSMPVCSTPIYGMQTCWKAGSRGLTWRGHIARGPTCFLADLRRANCKEINLQDVDLQGGDLSDADLSSAQVQDVRLA